MVSWSSFFFEVQWFWWSFIANYMNGFVPDNISKFCALKSMIFNFHFVCVSYFFRLAWYWQVQVSMVIWCMKLHSHRYGRSSIFFRLRIKRAAIKQTCNEQDVLSILCALPSRIFNILYLCIRLCGKQEETSSIPGSHIQGDVRASFNCFQAFQDVKRKIFISHTLSWSIFPVWLLCNDSDESLILIVLRWRISIFS